MRSKIRSKNNTAWIFPYGAEDPGYFHKTIVKLVKVIPENSTV
jgi:hypothetical protein